MSKSGEIVNLMKRVWRFGPYIPLSSLALAKWGTRLPESTVTAIHEKRNAKIREILKKQCRNEELPTQEKPITLTPEKTSKPIWLMWMQGEAQMPRLVKACTDSIRANSGAHEVIVLDKDNYRQYVTLNPRVEQLYDQGKIKPAHFADILRVNLLAQQGGLWLDSTIMLTAPLGEEVWERPFFTVKTAESGHFVSRCRWSVFCIGGDRGLPLFEALSEMFDRYLMREKLFVDYFMFDQLINLLYDERADIRQTIDSIPATNPQIYQLHKILTTDYSEEGYAALTADTSIFKLNRKTYSEVTLKANSASYFAFLEKKYGRTL